ncbi:hypothetical protein PHYSODRAFT_324541 [Phytophthora sojae]|uniref:Uncharacterized protein n=1 Tax=Phytophthora sojae (strain P6497) TaxID=1094619 RepID=G4YZ35_PHYSP|nr:hypothetical protein PHYSODRAFT_324541 [Phytophthora sojae]EGZ23316.1 hypothetical protein PHYSODRAFT_324541 [Phytophthora sojae]|eukprot:XP_009518604.1 hypothetical protein PHYSODRAFT_324541 [Phytophthora sojae]
MSYQRSYPALAPGSHMDDKNIKHERHQREALALRGLVTCEEVFAAHQREMGVLAEHAAAQMGDATGPLEEQLDKIAVPQVPVGLLIPSPPCPRTLAAVDGMTMGDIDPLAMLMHTDFGIEERDDLLSDKVETAMMNSLVGGLI